MPKPMTIKLDADQRRRVGVGFDGRGNSDTFGVKRRHFFGSRFGDMKSEPDSPALKSGSRTAAHRVISTGTTYGAAA
jgi:hypothetical protein